MVKTLKDHLLEAFDDLGQDKRRRFQDKLCDRREEPRVRRAQIEKLTDSWDLVTLMVETFTSRDAPAVTIEILEAIGCNEQAVNLREATGHRKAGAHDVPSPSSPAALLDKVDSKPSQSDLNDGQSDHCQTSLKLITCSQDFKDKILKEKGNEVYKPLDKTVRKRLALLITNIEFDKKSMNRRGAEKDEENMEWLLEKLDYNVVKHRNLSGNEMDNAIKDFAKRQEHANSDSTFVVIMSHGKRGAILGVHYDTTNNDILPVDNIYTHLNSKNCQALIHKPKVILIQACRGGEHGHVWVSDGEPEEPMEIEGDEFVHIEKDFTCLMSCTPDTKSYRHIKLGTFYVRCLVDVFGKYAHEDDIEELFRKVMRRFENDDMMGHYKQMVCKHRATKTKFFYLFPGL